MRAAVLVLLVALPSLPPAPIAPGPTSSPGVAVPPTELVLDGPSLDPLPAGDEVDLEVTVQRELSNRSVPGPGSANVTLTTPDEAGCKPRTQTVDLDATTGRGTAKLHCRPTQPGTWSVLLRAESDTSRPGNWQASLTVLPDRLEGNLEAGQPSAYRVPLNLTLEPVHLDQAPVDLSLVGRLTDSPLGVREDLGSLTADGSTAQRTLLARHGPGTYRLEVHARGPLTRNWTNEIDVTVPEPDPTGRLELNATVRPGLPSVELTGDTVNDDGKTKSPGDRLITRLRAKNAETVNVTVLRSEGDERVELARESLEVPDSGRLEHVFAHEPLPAGRVWVQASAANSSTARTANVRDLEVAAEAHGPDSVLGDGRPWRGNLVLEDPNFGSTPQDPGPVFGLPDLTWRVFHGSATADGFTVEMGPFQGPSRGEAATSRIPWPQGDETVDVEPGIARLPLTVTPPADVDPGTYRLSVYAPDGDRVGGPEFELAQPPAIDVTVGQARPGEGLPIRVDVDDPVPGTTTNLTVIADGTALANATVPASGNATPRLPAPLAAGADVTVEARWDWPGRPAHKAPDAVVHRSAVDVAPNVTVHPVLDGHAAPAPLAVHPAGSHEVEIAYSARDPNGGEVETTASLTGPGGTPGWPLEHEEGRVRVTVPADARVGRYLLNVTAEDAGGVRTATVPIDLAETVRLGVDGPEAVQLRQGETREVNLTVTNRGSVPVEAVTVALDAELELAARLSNGTADVAAGEPLGLSLEPGATREVRLAVTATGEPGRDDVAVTLAGVAP